MEYIERYLHQVKRLLPEKEQEEIIRELREILEEEVSEKQSGDLSPEKLEKNQLTVLEKFGRPESIAVKYGGGHSPLVAAELMPQFIKVLKILGTIYVVVFVGASIFLARNPFDLLDNFISNAMINFAIVVIIFYFVGKDKKQLHKSWKPSDLPPVQTKSNVNQGELLFSIALTSFFIIWITMFPEWLGYGYSKNGESFTFIPFNLDTLRPYIPFVILLLIGNVMLDVATLIQKVWTPLLHAGNIALSLMWIILANIVLHFGMHLSMQDLPRDFPNIFFTGDGILAVILAGSMVVAAADILKHIYKWTKIGIN